MENPRDEFKNVNELSPDLAGCNLARLYFWHFLGEGIVVVISWGSYGDIMEISSM